MSTALFTQLSEAEVRALIRTELEDFFSGKLDPTTPGKNQAEMGGIDLAAEITGLKKSTIYALVQQRSIPYRKKGKKLYFKRDEIEAWIESGRKLTVTEIQTNAKNVDLRHNNSNRRGG
jgi:excisionase family DNA binding protein